MSDRRLRVAVVGGGAAAVGVFSALEEWREELDVTQIDLPPGPRSRFDPEGGPSEARHTAADGRISQEYAKYLRQELGWKFPPAKSHFGVIPDALPVRNWGRIWASTHGGGLTRFWGASALPYPDSQFANWPISAAELRPHYQSIVDAIGVSGAEDALSRLWGGGLASRPPLHRVHLFEQLERHLAARASVEIQGYRFIAGSGRMAVETDPAAVNRCQLTGNCMSGCPHRAVFAAESYVTRSAAAGLIRSRVVGKALSFDATRKTLAIEVDSQRCQLGAFDIILLAAGCLASTAIALRSLPALVPRPIQDNCIYTFPLVYFGKHQPEVERTDYFGLTNLVVACIPPDVSALSMIQLYPFFDLLWQYYTPSVAWPAMRPLGRYLRRHASIARLYLPAEYSQTYRMTLDQQDKPSLILERAPRHLKEIPALWSAVRHGFSGNGFWVPPIPQTRQRTSSHYAATLPLGSDLCRSDGSITDGVYLCDSAAFPESSALSPTLTIMAYARLTATRALRSALNS